MQFYLVFPLIWILQSNTVIKWKQVPLFVICELFLEKARNLMSKLSGIYLIRSHSSKLNFNVQLILLHMLKLIKSFTPEESLN